MDDRDSKDMYEPLKLFVRDLPEDYTEQEIRDHFGQYGTIDRVRLIKKDGRLQNFGFVMYEEEESLEKCLKERTHTINGKTLEVKRAIQVGMLNSRGGGERRKVFIGGLSDDTTKHDIRQAVTNVDGINEDDIQEISIMTEKGTEKPRGFGFATMRSNALALKLVKLGNLEIKGSVVSLDHAIPKEEGKRFREEGRRRERPYDDDYYYEDRYYEDRYRYYDDRDYDYRYGGRYERYPPEYRRHPVDSGYYDDRPRMGPGFRGGPPERPPPRDYYGSDYGPTRHGSYYDREMSHPYGRR